MLLSLFLFLFLFLFVLLYFQAQGPRKKSIKTKSKSKSNLDMCICHLCGVRVMSASLLKKHMDIRHQLSENGPKITCPYPGRLLIIAVFHKGNTFIIL